MEPTINIHSKKEIVEALQHSIFKMSSLIGSISKEDFNKAQGEKWTIKEEFEHLIMSTEPVAKALSMPRVTFRAFGKLNRTPRNYPPLVQRYHEKLDEAPVVPPSRFSPKGKGTQNNMLNTWDNLPNSFSEKIPNWSDKALDKYLLPHPLLGKLTIREMLFFTNYHIQHHLLSIQRKVA